MAHVYAGELSRIDLDVLDVVKTLPDEFWAYAEFNGIGRNVDWFIARSSTHTPSVLMLMELKRVSRPLRGSIDGEWELLGENGVWQEIVPSNSKDRNYYWQSVNTANALADWLWNNQHRYREATDVRPADDFKIWPDLVLLSPPDLGHRLPLGPASRYGRWWYSLDDWYNHVLSWRPRNGISLSYRELDYLGNALGLAPLIDGHQRRVEPAPAPPSELTAFFGWLRDLDARLSRVEAALHSLNPDGLPRADAAAEDSGERSGVESFTPSGSSGAHAAARRTLSEEERQALTAAVHEVRARGRSRALPTIIDAMNLILGYRLQDTEYNGFGSARAMFEQARAEQAIRFGPYTGPNPTIYLAEEEPPVPM